MYNFLFCSNTVTDRGSHFINTDVFVYRAKDKVLTRIAENQIRLTPQIFIYTFRTSLHTTHI